MQSKLDAAQIEKMQLELQRDPKSQIFAPLSDAYRKMNLLEEALQIAQAGVLTHPKLASGRVALARILIAKNQYLDALTHLERAVELSPENRLGQMLRGEVLLKLRRPKDALNAFKLVLFINPNDERAQKIVKKWEFLTAEDFSDEAFQSIADSVEQKTNWDEARAISIADALTVRNEVNTAIKLLKKASPEAKASSEVQGRLKNLLQKSEVENLLKLRKKKSKLEYILQRIRQSGKVVDPKP